MPSSHPLNIDSQEILKQEKYNKQEQRTPIDLDNKLELLLLQHRA